MGYVEAVRSIEDAIRAGEDALSAMPPQEDPLRGEINNAVAWLEDIHTHLASRLSTDTEEE